MSVSHPTSPRKKGPGRRHQQGEPLLRQGEVLLRGVTMAPHWPGGKAGYAKLEMRRRTRFTAAQVRAAKELGFRR